MYGNSIYGLIPVDLWPPKRLKKLKMYRKRTIEKFWSSTSRNVFGMLLSTMVKETWNRTHCWNFFQVYSWYICPFYANLVWLPRILYLFQPLQPVRCGLPFVFLDKLANSTFLFLLLRGLSKKKNFLFGFDKPRLIIIGLLSIFRVRISLTLKLGFFTVACALMRANSVLEAQLHNRILACYIE